MIHVAPVSSGAATVEYLTQDSYYTADQSLDTSEWLGKGAEALGLAGTIDKETFAAAVDGKLPDGSVIQGKDGVHRLGDEIHFSVSKSVSLMALVGGDKRLIEAFKESAKVTLKWAEKNVVEARVWNKDRDCSVPERTGNMLVASFLHDVNRNQESHLHIHAIALNATQTADGQWRAVHNREFYRAQHVMSAIHNAELRARVEALGYETVPARKPIDGAFEIKGVSREVIEAFSTRRAEVLTEAAKGGRSSARELELAALSTRKGKEIEPDIGRLAEKWKETAQRVGFNPQPLIDKALARSSAEQTVWSRVVEGIRGIGAKGMAIASAIGLTPKDQDPLVPERLGRLEPKAFAAAQAIASAARELGEREAAFSRNDLIRTALERQGPFTVEAIEARIDHLQERGLLIGSGPAGGDRMLTTEQAVAMENKVIALARAGKDSVEPIAERDGVVARLQENARAIGLRRLNQGQEKAGADILASKDRIHLVQGGAGVGKSAALAPVAAIVREQGRRVLALSHVGRIAREFGEKTASPASTVDAFLGRYVRVLDGSANAEKIADAREELSGSLVMVDEASQIGTDRLARLIHLANKMEVGRLVLAGDIKQLPAIEAGKPFAQLQGQDLGKSGITENLRAQTPQMQAVNRALDKGDVGEAFKALKPATIEVASGDIARTAAQKWTGLPKDEREQTVLLAAGRAMRSAGNSEAQQALAARGEIGAKSVSLEVLDRVTVTREGARQLKGYHEGRLVAFRTNLPSQGFRRGERGEVVDVRDDKVELHMGDGELRQLDPSRLPRNLKHDAVTIFERKAIELHEQDRIRWTTKDAERGLLNGDIAHIDRITGDAISVKTGDGKLHELQRSDPMLERLDLGYAINVHVAQGITAKDGIIMMSERERMLNSSASFLVAVTRIAANATLVTDNSQNIERQVGAKTGEKTSAIETARKSEHYPGFSQDLKKLSEKLGPQYAMAVLENRERDMAREKQLGRGDGPERAQDLERGR